jgi:hypothetical protein
VRADRKATSWSMVMVDYTGMVPAFIIFWGGWAWLRYVFSWVPQSQQATDCFLVPVSGEDIRCMRDPHLVRSTDHACHGPWWSSGARMRGRDCMPWPERTQHWWSTCNSSGIAGLAVCQVY